MQLPAPTLPTAVRSAARQLHDACWWCPFLLLVLLVGLGQGSHGRPGHSCPSEGTLGWVDPRQVGTLFISVCSGLSTGPRARESLNECLLSE